MKKRLWTLAVTTAFVVTACTQRATAITIHTIGDSTMSHYDQDVPAQKGMDGWGDFLQDCMKEGVTVYNWADRGETARSYYNGIWNKISRDRPEFAEPIMNKVKSGDYVIIQFGHNDSKSYSTVKYEEWLGKLVDAVKEKGATPIIASSICRSRFDKNGKITPIGRIDRIDESKRIQEEGIEVDAHSFDYPYHARKVAEAKNIEFIDITTGVKQLFEEMGEASTRAFFPGDERTHTNGFGAKTIAKIAARLLLDTKLKKYVNPKALTLPTKQEVDTHTPKTAPAASQGQDKEDEWLNRN